MGDGGGQVGAARFATTRWTVVREAAGWDGGAAVGSAAQRAMAELCQAYWYPVYAFVRRSGRSAVEAEDLTQGFFAAILEKGSLARADAKRGRFRNFLLGALRHYLANEWDRENAQKRGGGRVVWSLDWNEARERYGLEPADGMTPERSYERQWALAVLRRVLDRLEAEFAGAGRGRVFEELKEVLAGSNPREGYGAIARRLGTTEGTIKVMVHRMRRRYRELLQEEVAETVEDRREVEGEIGELIAAVRGGGG